MVRRGLSHYFCRWRWGGKMIFLSFIAWPAVIKKITGIIELALRTLQHFWTSWAWSIHICFLCSTVHCKWVITALSDIGKQSQFTSCVLQSNKIVHALHYRRSCHFILFFWESRSLLLHLAAPQQQFDHPILIPALLGAWRGHEHRQERTFSCLAKGGGMPALGKQQHDEKQSLSGNWTSILVWKWTCS